MRSLGAMMIWVPRWPALIEMMGHCCADWSRYTGSGFLVPKGETPPRIYPVRDCTSLRATKSAFLPPATAPSVLVLSSESPGIQAKAMSRLPVRATRVLNTCSAGMLMRSATCSALRLDSSTVYVLIS